MGLGLRALKGGAAVVAVTVDHGEPRVVLSAFLATSAKGDRLSVEPYHVAADLERAPRGGVSPEAAAIVTRGRDRQNALAAQGLRAVLRGLDAAQCTPVAAGLLVNRAGWITDLLEYSQSWREHLPVAEALAVRDALRFACHACRIGVIEVDEKALPEHAPTMLLRSRAEIDAQLKSLGATAAGAWRREQRLACLAAWFVLTAKR